MNRIDTDQIKRQNPLDEVFRSYGIKLEKSNGTFKCCCPFHNEKTPSCHIYPDDHFYCFGCAASGDVISLVQKLKGLSFIAAITKLSGGIEFQQTIKPRPARKPTEEKLTCEIATGLADQFYEFAPDSLIKKLSSQIGVSIQSLNALRCGYNTDRNVYTFPMRNWDFSICGIRTRALDGTKKAIERSKEGLFAPALTNQRSMWNEAVMIVEGPTDCAAALDLGFYSIGRPSCTGASEQTIKFLLHIKPKYVIVVSDNDGPGLAGSQKLCEKIKSETKFKCTRIVLPTKDIREFKNNGGTKQVIEAIINSTTPI